MPLPVIAGIPLIAGVIGGLFSAVFSYAVKFLSKRFAMVIAGIAILTSITAAFFAGLSALVSSISIATPPFFTLAVQMVVPDNAVFCISSILTAHLLRYAYVWNVKIIQYKLF